MEKEVKIKLGYCPNCKMYNELLSIEDIETSPVGIGTPVTRGIFFEDDITYHKSRPIIDHQIMVGRGCEIHSILFWGWSDTDD